jgi:hypothetical protein
METLTEEKIHMSKKARLAVQSLEREMEEKARQAHELKVERLRKQQKVEETPLPVSLRPASTPITIV